MKTDEELKAYVAAHPGVSIRDMLKSLSVRHHVRADDLRRVMGFASPETTLAPRPVGKSVTLLLAQFDDLDKVRKAMKALPRDSYLEDDELRRQLQIGLMRWREVVGHASLAALQYKLPDGKRVWMHPDGQRKLAAAISLSETV